ncbi:unnamed protein product [Aureobasidium pullulans]|nr:unnamed protein product [Aureobasidium pullulans]
MESLRNAATAAASYVGLGGTPEENRGKQLQGSRKTSLERPTSRFTMPVTTGAAIEGCTNEPCQRLQ